MLNIKKREIMKKIFTLLIVMCGLFPVLNAQTALDPNQFVNTQITGPGVYTVEAGKFYAFDGRWDLTFDVTIQGPDNGWIMKQANPPVIVQTPGADGSQRQFMEIKAGGSFTLKNVILSGTHSNDAVGRVFINNTGGSKYKLDNVVITDWEDFALRNQNADADSISVTNCVFINGVRLRYNQYGGFPIRLDVSPKYLKWENNTGVNVARLLANNGPFMNADMTVIHNTYVNQITAAEETRAHEIIYANNIFYNYHFLGYKTANHSVPDDLYNTFFVNWNDFFPVKDNLDKVSLYFGQNLFFREQQITDWFTANGGDSIAPSLFWETARVDSIIMADDNYTFGANYTDIDPGFTTPPGNTAKMLAYNTAHYTQPPPSNWVDWRITSPVSWNAETGLPSLSWPPAFDLSYSNTDLQMAGTDGLPLGDLNWFPEKKAEYLANRDAYLTAIRDSMVNAKVFYDPLTMENTPMLSKVVTSVKQISAISGEFDMSNYPNPFNNNTAIRLRLPQQANVTLSVYNVAGVKVFELTEKELQAGTHEFSIDASNLSSGIYLYKANAIGINGQNYVSSKKMIKE
jgi:hypothetical protein